MKLIRIHYLDASAIVKLVLAEEGSRELREYFGKESNFSATSLCFAEALGALKVKAFYRNEISDEEHFSGCDELLAHVAHNTIEIENIENNDRHVFDEVERLVRNYNEGKPKDKTIDISDAFQMVSVKQKNFYQFENDSKPILITGDRASADAANNEGLRVWNCVDEPAPEELTESYYNRLLSQTRPDNARAA
ncbi:MAG: hypothetical protein HY695_16685 [Deltaproteobacteria bacterium]|nr:hypothetical protein [Deltaproteobacteria bacterium]